MVVKMTLEALRVRLVVDALTSPRFFTLIASCARSTPEEGASQTSGGRLVPGAIVHS